MNEHLLSINGLHELLIDRNEHTRLRRLEPSPAGGLRFKFEDDVIVDLDLDARSGFLIKCYKQIIEKLDSGELMRSRKVE